MGVAAVVGPGRLGRDFWIFFAGQSVSAFGTAFTRFALPLLVFRLTGSPIDLAITTATTFLPVLLFGLVIGAWTDRVDRTRLMIASDLGRAAIVASVPLLASLGMLSVAWIYVAAFLTSVLAMTFETSEASAISSIVKPEDLPTANGWLHASYALASSVGLFASGLVVTSVPLQVLMLIDAGSFVLSALCLPLIGRDFNGGQEERLGRTAGSTLRAELAEGVYYVVRDRGLLSLALMCTALNLVGSSASTQLVVLATGPIGADDAQIAMLFASGSIGVVIMSLSAGVWTSRMSIRAVILAMLVTRGMATLGLGTATSIYAAAPIWAVAAGSEALFNVATLSVVQVCMPDQILGRVLSVVRVLAWSSIPVGALIGGYVVEVTERVAIVYIGIGVAIVVVAVFYAFAPRMDERSAGSLATPD